MASPAFLGGAEIWLCWCVRLLLYQARCLYLSPQGLTFVPLWFSALPAVWGLSKQLDGAELLAGVKSQQQIFMILHIFPYFDKLHYFS